MRRHRRKQIRYGITSGVVAFAAGWAVAAFLTPQTALDQFPRWQSTLWVYFGAQFVEASAVNFGGFASENVDVLEVADVPRAIHVIPLIVVCASALYTSAKFNSARIKHSVSNAMTAGTGYFLVALVAMLVSDLRPTISAMLIAALVAGGGIWLGSSFIGLFSRGIPLLGVASLGTVAALGILLLMGGLAILSVIAGLIGVAFGVAAVTGLGVGISRRLERRGRRYDTGYPRIQGLRHILSKNWREIAVVGVVLGALIFGIQGGV